jgi:uncharacterized phage-associated protein
VPGSQKVLSAGCGSPLHMPQRATRRSPKKKGKMIITETIIESLYYILQKIGEADKIKLVKLIYLADKYHLIRYGRTITNDDYYAMEYGPVGTTLKDVLSYDSSNISEHEKKYFSELIERKEAYTFQAKKDVNISFDMLSETDKEALNFVIEHFGNINSKQLSEYTHQYPEWNQYKDLFENNLTRRERIETIELLSTIKDDPLASGIPEDHLKESEKILTGNFD